MACCGDGGCSCLIIAGENIVVEGSGTPTNPWVISTTVPSLEDQLEVNDSATVNLSLLGGGTSSDPFRLSAQATVRVVDLVDVQDPSGGPAAGESLVFVPDDDAGHFEFATLPPSPAGSVNAGNGIEGIGSIGDPLELATAAVWGVGELAGLGGDSTIGLPVYIDSAGKVRAKPVTGVTWASITDKPATFTPSVHTHTASQITDPLNLDVGKVRAKSFHTTASSAAPPPPGEVTALGMWFFPKGS